MEIKHSSTAKLLIVVFVVYVLALVLVASIERHKDVVQIEKSVSLSDRLKFKKSTDRN